MNAQTFAADLIAQGDRAHLSGHYLLAVRCYRLAALVIAG